MYSIFAGIMISLGCIINLQIGGICGAVFFSLGLITILVFGLNLFTGKAGLLATREITWKELLFIWLGNLCGCIIMAAIMMLTPMGLSLSIAARSIIAVRVANGMLANIILGTCCGILMSVAVGLFKKENNPLYAIMPVAVFILSGFNHCVADMFYLAIGGAGIWGWSTIIFTTIGNIIGTYFVPFALNHRFFFKKEK